MVTCLFSVTAVANGDPLQQAYTGVQQYAGIGAVSFLCLLATWLTSTRFHSNFLGFFSSFIWPSVIKEQTLAHTYSRS